jgi:deazaflavin-dependent oxidoreductase (nitroreductase family)
MTRFSYPFSQYRLLQVISILPTKIQLSGQIPIMLKSLFRTLLSFSVWMYQRTDGKFGGKVRGLPILLLTTTGRKTGKQRITPLGYFEYEGYYVISATYAGLDIHPAWFHNLKSNPKVALQVHDKQLTAIADPADPTLRKQLWNKLVELAPGYGEYEKRTTREIPMVLLRPVSNESSR